MEGNELKRALKTRHITMISIGGAIGTGLFLASGNVVQNAGALGGPLSYLLIGLLVYVLMRGLGEMCTFMPVSGGYTTFAGLFVHPILGFMVGWNVSINGFLGLGAEIVAGSMLLNQFFPAIPPVVWCIAISVLLLVLNLFTVKAYGEAEFWFAGIKVVAIVIFLIVGVLMIFGLVGDQGFIGLSNWTGKSMIPNGFGAVILMMSAVVWSYLGVETTAIAAGETENPSVNVPKAINTVFYRIVLFYVGSVTVIGLVVPYGDVSVMSNGYAGLLALAGIPAAAVIMNIVIITSLTSSANSTLYALSRIMVGLAQEGKAPKALAKINKKGIPVTSVLFSIILAQVSLLTSFASPDKVFIWLISIAGFNTLLGWFSILLSSYKFRKWLVDKGGSVEKLTYKMNIYPIPTLVCLAVIIIIAIYTAYSPATRTTFLIGAPMLVLYAIIGTIVYKKGKMVYPDYQKYLDAHNKEEKIVS
ncbi:MAG TPA: amino acid permease [Anaerovoracaceae bacterium]|nr:amino acid permease [Anaerovoracaceae bacterium]